MLYIFMCHLLYTYTYSREGEENDGGGGGIGGGGGGGDGGGGGGGGGSGGGGGDVASEVKPAEQQTTSRNHVVTSTEPIRGPLLRAR